MILFEENILDFVAFILDEVLHHFARQNQGSIVGETPFQLAEQSLYGFVELPLLLERGLLDIIEAKAIQDCLVLHFLMGKVHGPHLLVIEIFDGKIRQQPSVCELHTLQVDFFPCVSVVDIVFPPLFFPFLGFESTGEGSRHMHGGTDWQVGGGFVVEESQDVIFQIDCCARELNSC